MRRERLTRGLHAHVVNLLGQEICDGVLGEGALLSSEEVCARFSVSRSVARESLRALESMGLVHAKPQVGTRVQSIAQWDLLSPQVVLWRGSGPHFRKQMREVLEFRRGIEPAAAEFAAHSITEEALEALRAAASEMGEAVDAADPRAFLQADMQFHRIVLESSGNRLMAQFADTVSASLETRAAAELEATLHSTTHESVARHVKLADAIAERDPWVAERWSRMIIDSTIEEFKDSGLLEQHRRG